MCIVAIKGPDVTLLVPCLGVDRIVRVGCQRGALCRVARARRLHISDYRLPAIIDVNVLDADILVSAVTEAAKGLDLCGIGPHQPSRGCCERHYSAL
jgi:hypothetical protein